MMPSLRPAVTAGFTLIELMIALAVLAILTAVALPSYNSYIQRSKAPVALDALSAFATRMEQRYQDVGSYGADGCALSPVNPANFTLDCSIGDSGNSFEATATGSGAMEGYKYSIDSSGTRKTVEHPKGVPSSNCWSTKGSVCDS
ncbi:pilus assembly protein PilE [Rubrivivax gelatinosus]|uniref:type IV pilin protein n=1 Tax=Rubrivivax gelatinosus TaxID=28068 RepID=UPI0019057FF9|nr:type IV pilin protein [Rubrivivax gelatinosus]MBK1614861.1 pilus assembly protein PilE [Rubrivivax gelatinosus]